MGWFETQYFTYLNFFGRLQKYLILICDFFLAGANAVPSTGFKRNLLLNKYSDYGISKSIKNVLFFCTGIFSRNNQMGKHPHREK